MTDDLIKRLRSFGEQGYPIAYQSADALEAQAKRIAELEAECARDQRNAAVSQQESVMLLDRCNSALFDLKYARMMVERLTRRAEKAEADLAAGPCGAAHCGG
jgi:hypothetical protein